MEESNPIDSRATRGVPEPATLRAVIPIAFHRQYSARNIADRANAFQYTVYSSP